ncbi:18797_t:CDS:1, partial [Racocetra fulgida]
LFAPQSDQGEIKKLYIELVYSYTSDDDNNSTDHSSDSVSNNNDIPSGRAYQHWQYAHRQFCQYIKKVKGKNK